MATASALECLRCSRRYPVVSMPAGCPSCSAEGTPSNVTPIYTRMQALRPNRLSGEGLARYSSQLPVTRDRLVSLGEGGTPLLAVPALGRAIGARRMLVKDERRGPTGSWRDRYAALAVSQVTDVDTTIAAAGDQALSVALAAYAARAGLRSVHLVEAHLGEEGSRVLDAIEAVGGRAVGVSGSEARWMLLQDAERTLGWRAFSNRTMPPIGGDPLSIEAYKTIAYEIVEELRLGVPDLVAVPDGAGRRHPGRVAGLPRDGGLGRGRLAAADGGGGGRGRRGQRVGRPARLGGAERRGADLGAGARGRHRHRPDAGGGGRVRGARRPGHRAGARGRPDRAR